MVSSWTSALTNPAPTSSDTSPFPSATVFWRTATKTSNPRTAWLAISTAVRWKPLATPNEVAPTSFDAFRGHPCLALERLPPDSLWKDVEQAVSVTDTQDGFGLCISGCLSRQTVGLFVNRKVALVVAADSADQRNSWMDALRIRIAPWTVLYRRFKDELLDGPLSYDVIRAVFEVADKNRDENNAIWPTEYVETLQDVAPVAEGLEILSGFVETVATAVKTCVPYVKDTAESVADVAKCVTVLGSAITVVVLCATLAEMGMEAKRGIRQLPRLQSTIRELRGDVVKSMVQVLHPNGNVDERLVRDVFEVQEQLFDVLTRIESQMMRRGIGRLWNAGDLREIEEVVDALKRSVIDVIQSGSIAVNSTRISLLETNAASSYVTPMRYRPEVNPYFVGREKEIALLKKKLEQYGSVAIMQFGGVGKTQLTAAFAENAERSGLVPGGSFWLGAHGGRFQIVHSLADFAEALAKTRLRNEDREDVDAVLSALRRKLESITGRWLLCIDNADDSETNPIVGKTVRLASATGGWVVVTSRQGGLTLWDGMESEQKLQLKPLHVEQAMIVLYRWKTNRLRIAASDMQVMALIERLEQEDVDEFRALHELAGDEKEHGLAGHSLALAQAGSFMLRHNVTFSKYVDLYIKKREDKAVLELFQVVEDDGLRKEHQRSVWLTWKINVDELSDIGRAVLRSFALFDQRDVPKSLIQKLDPNFTDDSFEFLKVVRRELVNCASLIQENGEGLCTTFTMHRLIRRFVAREVKSDDGTCFQSVLRAVRALHECVGDELKSTGNSLESPPKTSCTPKACTLLPHVIAVLVNGLQVSWLRSDRLSDSSHLVDLFRFACRAQAFLGQFREATSLCHFRYEALFAIYRGVDHRNVAEALRDQGCVASRNGEFEKAKGILNQGLEMYKRIHGEEVDHYDIACILHELGSVALGKGVDEEAKKWYEESLAMKRRIYGEEADNADIASTLHELGRVAVEKGMLEEAEKWYVNSLAMKRKIYGESVDHHDVAIALHELGRVARRKGAYEESRKWFEKSLAMKRRILGDKVDHPDVASILHGLGRVAFERGVYKDAQERYEESLSMNRRIYGENVDHHEVAVTLHGLGRVAQGRGLYGEAKKWYEESLAMNRRIYGETEDHRDVAVLLHGLGRIAIELGACEDAQEWFEKSLGMKKRIYGESVDHSSIASTLYGLGRVAIRKKAYEQAEKWYVESLAMKRRIYGETVDHPNVASILRELGRVSLEKGVYEEAQKWYEEGLAMCRRIYGEKVDHPHVALALQCMGGVACKNSLFNNAVKLYTDSLEMWHRILGIEADHLEIVRVLFELGIVKKAMGRVEEAKELFQKSEDMKRRISERVNK